MVWPTLMEADFLRAYMASSTGCRLLCLVGECFCWGAWQRQVVLQIKADLEKCGGSLVLGLGEPLSGDFSPLKKLL